MIPVEWISFIANLLGLVGVGLLAIPALHASRYGLKAVELNKARASFEGDLLQAHLQSTSEELQTIRDSWSKAKSNCLIYGTTLAGLSYLILALLDLWQAIP